MLFEKTQPSLPSPRLLRCYDSQPHQFSLLWGVVFSPSLYLVSSHSIICFFTGVVGIYNFIKDIPHWFAFVWFWSDFQELERLKRSSILILKLEVQGIPWWSSGQDAVLPLWGEIQVQSLVRELRSCNLFSVAKKKKKKFFLIKQNLEV